jgi:hypothetical protein
MSDPLHTAVSALRDRTADFGPGNLCLRVTTPASQGMLDLADLEAARKGLSAAAVRGLTCGSHRKVKLVSFPPDDEGEEALEPRLTTMHRAATLHEESRGTHDLRMGFPFLSGDLGRGLVIQAPLFFFPVRLEEDLDQGRFSGWQLQGRSDGNGLEVNRFLLLALRRFARTRIGVDEMEELAWKVFYEGGLHAAPDDPREYLTRLVPDLMEMGLSLAQTPRPRARAEEPETDRLPEDPPVPEGEPGRFYVAPSAVLGRFDTLRAVLAEDQLALLRSIQRDEDLDRGAFWARIALGEDDGGLGETRQMSSVAPAVAGPPGDHLWPVVPWDGDQEAILGRVGWGKHAVVEAPAGTGKTQTLVNLAAASQARGGALLVVSDRREGLEEIKRRLVAVGLGDGAVVLRDPTVDRENIFRAVRKRLRARPPKPSGEAGAARDAALETLAGDVEWFDAIHPQLIGDGGPRSPFVSYVRRSERRKKLSDELVDSLPVIEPTDLDALLEPIAAYCLAKRKTLVPTESVPKRPSYATSTPEDLDRALKQALPSAKEAIREARTWTDSENSPGMPIQRAAETHDELLELREFLDEAPPLGDPSWSSIETARKWLASPDAARAEADPVAADTRRIERFIERRTKTGGKFLRTPSDAWGELKADLDTWDEFEENAIRVLNPSFYAVKKRLQEVLRAERLSADDVGRGARRLRRRLSLARMVRSTLATLSITTLDRHALKKAPDEALRAAPRNAGVALEFVKRWQGVPEQYEASLKVTIPRTRKQHDVQVARARHALAAKAVHEKITAAKAALAAWIGASAEGWVDYAFQQDRPELLDGWFDTEVAGRFDVLAEADRLVASVEEADAKLAEIALELSREGDKSPAATLSAAFAERWIRDAEAECPELAEFAEGADRRRRKRLNEATSTLLDGGAAAVLERIATRINALPETMSALDEVLEASGRTPSLATFVTRFWDRGLKDLVPVWLCTPEAAAAIPPGDRFDIVAFDDADALTLERALPAARRGRTALVLGDSRRPGPDAQWNFFLRCRAAIGATRFSLNHGAAFPHLTDARRTVNPSTPLRSAPLFHPRPKPPAIELIRIAGAWTRRGNVIEADAVSELLGQLTEADPERTIAIITATEAQRDCVEARIRRRGLRSRGFRSVVGAARGREIGQQAIVRALSELRGESRDIVLFAPGIAAEGDTAHPSSLGPLGGADASGYLDSVLATARTKIIVLSSIDPESALAEDGPSAPLRRTLIEAASWTRGARRSFPPRHHTPSTEVLAASITKAIEALGYPCQRDLGASDCRIDIAVHDSVRPRPFLLAILLDGPSSAWAPGARIREHSRWDLLRTAGWAVTSVSAWSWLRNRDEVMERLKVGLEKSATGKRPRPLRPPPIGPMPSGTIDD